MHTTATVSYSDLKVKALKYKVISFTSQRTFIRKELERIRSRENGGMDKWDFQSWPTDKQIFKEL